MANNIPPVSNFPERQPENTSPSRREVISGVLQAAVLAIGAAVARILRLKHIEQQVPAAPPPPKRKEVVPSSAENWTTGELTEDKVLSFMAAFSQLKRDSIMFIDQNGNIIYGAPIPIPADISAKERTINSTEFQKIFQAWLNEERRRIQAAFPTVHVAFAENREEPTLLSVRKSHETSADESLFACVLKNSKAAVSRKNRKSRLQFARELFAKSSLPPELAVLFIGACAAESQFSEIGANGIGAAGPWQIMPRVAKKLGLMGAHPGWKNKFVKKGRKGPKRIQRVRVYVPFDDRNNFGKSTPAAIKYMEEIYERLARNQAIREIQRMYGMSDEDFLYQIVINSYQAGEGTIGKMCKWFKENYSPEQVEAILGRGPYGKDLYTLMTYVYIQSGNDLNFGKQSRDYVIRAMAMRELFSSAEEEGRLPEFDNDAYVPPAPSREPEAEMSGSVTAMVRSGMKNGYMQTLGVGAVTAATAVAIGKALEADSRFKRRDALVGVLGFGAAAVGRALANIEASKPAPEKPVVPEKQLDNQFAPYVLDEQGIQQALLASEQQMLKGVPHRTKAERRKLKDRIATGLEIAKKFNLPKFETAEDIQKAGLKDVPQYSSPHYRLRGVGMLNDGNTDNDDKYTRCYPHTENLISRISQELNEELYAQGFPRRFRVRLIVKGVSRSETFQEALRKRNPYAARGDSPHMYGHSFDLHKSKFDIIDTSGDGMHFSMISTSPADEVNNKLHLCLKISAVLGRILIKFKESGELSPIDEGANPVFHISDKHPKS